MFYEIILFLLLIPSIVAFVFHHGRLPQNVIKTHVLRFFWVCESLVPGLLRIMAGPFPEVPNDNQNLQIYIVFESILNDLSVAYFGSSLSTPRLQKL